jgi:Flp pilus assembly protein TadG
MNIKAKRRNERGITIMAVALILPVVMIMLGLALDLAIGYMVRTNAQAAADAAALSGAFSYVNNPSVSDANAIADAKTAGNLNLLPVQWISGNIVSKVAPASLNVTQAACPFDATLKCVTAVAAVSSPTFFSKAIGYSHIPVAVTAVAQAGTQGAGAYCVKPIFVPWSAINGRAAGYQIPNIRPTDPSGALVPSNYYSMDMDSAFDPVLFEDGSSDGSHGTPTYNDSWQKCVVNLFSCSSPITVKDKPGNLGGNTDKDVQQYTDTFVAVGDYDPGDRDTSSSLVTVPVWDDSSKLTFPKSGLMDVNLKGFATIFIDPLGGGKNPPISAHFIRYLGCPASPSAGSGPMGAPVRLVQ